MKKRIYVGVILLLNSAVSSLAVQEEGCVTAVCHQTLLKMKTVHPPLEDGSCDACHTPLAEGAAHPEADGAEFGLGEESVSAICSGCHEITPEQSTHPPVQDGECQTCHEPHASNQPALLRGTSPADVCKECHDIVTEPKKFVHGPAAVGECAACHDPHGKTGDNLLNKIAGPDLCFSCHDDKKEEFTVFAVTHAPVQVNCAGCHDPHESDFPYQLRGDGADLCGLCHEAEAKAARETVSAHQPVQETRRCLNCHGPHGAAADGLLAKPANELCLDCHNKTVTADDGREMLNIKATLNANPNVHAPLEDGCATCHNPHGSGFSRLLKLAYPVTTYQAYEPKAYGLCFDCHEAAAFAKEKSTATEFRDGDRNLHFLHVNKKKGRVCSVCHDVHAAPKPHQLRDTTRFGSWNLPIGYSETDTGGSCAPGCHKPQTYTK